MGLARLVPHGRGISWLLAYGQRREVAAGNRAERRTAARVARSRRRDQEKLDRIRGEIHA